MARKNEKAISQKPNQKAKLVLHELVERLKCMVYPVFGVPRQKKGRET